MLKFYTQVVLVYFQPLPRNSLFEMRVAAQNPEKFTKTPYYADSRSFKVIDVDISKKLVASAYYLKKHVCAYLQPFSR